MTQPEDIQEILVRIELLAFFQANPHTRDTANGMAARLHRSPERIKKACDTLVSLGILQTNPNSKNTIYRLKNGELIKDYYQKNAASNFTLLTEQSDVKENYDLVRGKS